MQNETPYWLTRFVFQRFLGFIYFIAFLVALHQFIPLLGENGLLPVRLFLVHTKFWEVPSLFWFYHSDDFITFIAIFGLVLSILAMTGLSDRFGIFVSVPVWGLLWLFYLSFVNVGQTFYSFGWESLLLETGFLAIFLGPSNSSPSRVILWLYRWVLFRLMFGAGLIKIRGDSCWRDLTCMMYHYETQPLPNPLSWYFHWLPPMIHKGSVLFNHFVELIVPFGFFGPRMFACLAGGFTFLFQFLLILSGNLSWLNYLSILLCISCFDDAFFKKFIPVKIPALKPMSRIRMGLILTLTAGILFLSIKPTINLFSHAQLMNSSFEPLHLVNTYGAFGSITRERMEIVFEGTDESEIGPSTKWLEYEFKAKPGDVKRLSRIVAPYHYRLDWLMWFAAMSDYRYYPWILNLVEKLLKNDARTLSLMGKNPFPNAPPKYIRAELYHYRFTTPEERESTGQWWTRTRVEPYLPPLSLDTEGFQEALKEMGWI